MLFLQMVGALVTALINRAVHRAERVIHYWIILKAEASRCFHPYWNLPPSLGL